MSSPSLQQLLHGIQEVSGAHASWSFTHLRTNSHEVGPGDLFAALSGQRTHGMEYIAEAAARGARAALVEATGATAMPNGVPSVAIPGLRQQLGTIADRFYGSPSHDLHVIGVTGTNGKTSVVQLLNQCLHRQGLGVASIGTLGSGLYGHLQAGSHTTPDVASVHRLLAAFRDQRASHVAMEVSSHALDQGRVAQVRFDTVVFTNLTRDHLDYHADLEAYFAAKSKLFTDFASRCALVNVDDPWGERLCSMTLRSERTIRYSARGQAHADLRAEDVQVDASGIAFALHAGSDSQRVRSPLLGLFNVDNLLAVAAYLLGAGMPLAAVAQQLGQLSPVPGRMNRITGEAADAPLVVVDYAHTPDALEKALLSLRAHGPRQLICVFGCGGDRDRGKRALMGAVAERHADRIVLTDDNPRHEDHRAIIEQIQEGIRDAGKVSIEPDRARAIRLAVRMAEAGDGVLIAGKGHEPYQEVCGVRRAFDDSQEAQAALRGRA